MATKIGLQRFKFWRRRGDLGRRGEDLAARELERRGYVIVEQRWRCPLGEIDIVARDGETVVIAEVKTRSRDDFGAPIDAVDHRKRRKLVQLARAYARARRLDAVNVRFDVVGVTVRPGSKPRIELCRSASEA